MNVVVSPFQLEGCKCRVKFDPKEIQTALDEAIKKRIGKNSKALNKLSGDLSIGGRFSEIDEGNFALHFMLAFLGKAWISGQIQVVFNGKTIVEEPFRISKTFAAFTGGKAQLKGDAKFLADSVVKKAVKAIKQ